MHGLQQLLVSDLAIPLWQIILYVGLVSYFMFQRWFKLAFLTSFLLALYWLYYAFRPDLVIILNEARLARAIYYLLAFALILLSIFALTFLEVDADSLLDKREKEITRLKAQAKSAEKAAAALQAQLEQSDLAGAAGGKKRAKKLTAKIDRLQDEVRQAARLLEDRNVEFAALQAEADEAKKNVAALEALLEMCNSQPAIQEPVESEVKTKIAELEGQLCDRDTLLQQQAAEISMLRGAASEGEAPAFELGRQLRDEVERLRDELTQRDALLDTRDAEIAAMRAASQTNVAAGHDSAEVRHGDMAAEQREQELRSEVEHLKRELEQASIRMEGHAAEVAEWKATAAEANKTTANLKLQLEKEQNQGSASRRKLEEKLHAKISSLEKQLKQNESVAEKRNDEISALRLKAADAERQASALKANWQREQAEQSAAHRQAQKEADTHISRLEKQLEETQGCLQTRESELEAVQEKLAEGERRASTLAAQLESQNSKLSSGSEQQAQLHAQITVLEQELQQERKRSRDRNAELAALQRKTADAEKNVSVLAARLEKEHRAESAANNAIEKELKKKIAGLEKKLQEYDVLLENRNLEITALQTRAGDAEKQRAAAEARIEEERKQWSEAQHSLERDFTGKISEFEKRLEASDQLLKARDAELAESKARAIEAAESAATARAQLQQNNSEISSARKGTDELQGKISSLEGQLKESGTLLKARNSEIAALRAQASESQKKITELQEQFDAATQASAKGQKAGGELNTRIATLEQKLEETEKLLEARAAEIAALQGKSTPENGARGANAAVAGGNRKGFSNERREDKEDKEDDVRKRLHQFQYAVKYLEDELKEKDRLISLMTKKQAQVTPVAGKNPTDEDLKKRVHQLEQSVKYLENQNKEKDGLLSLMAKRNRELADLKSKAEERLEAMEGNTDGTQTTKSQPDVESER